MKRKFDNKKIYTIEDVRQAFPLMNKLSGKEEKDTYVLSESDLCK